MSRVKELLERLKERESKLGEITEEKKHLEKYARIIEDKSSKLFAISFNKKPREKAEKLLAKLESLNTEGSRDFDGGELPIQEARELRELARELEEAIESDLFYITYQGEDLRKSEKKGLWYYFLDEVNTHETEKS